MNMKLLNEEYASQKWNLDDCIYLVWDTRSQQGSCLDQACKLAIDGLQKCREEALQLTAKISFCCNGGSRDCQLSG